MRQILAILFVSLLNIHLQAELRVAVVNYKQISEQYNQAKVVSDEFKAAQEKLKQELQAKWDSFQKLMDQGARLQKAINDPMLSQDQRFQKHQEFKSLELKLENEKNALRKFKAEREKIFQQRYLTESEKIINQIAQAAATLAQEKSYDLILNNSDTTSHASVLVQYIQSSNDITSLLIERLNKK